MIVRAALLLAATCAAWGAHAEACPRAETAKWAKVVRESGAKAE